MVNSSPEAMLNVSPSRAITRRARDFMQIAAIAISLGVFIAIVAIAMYAVPFVTESSSAYGAYNMIRGGLFLLAGVLALVGVGLVARGMTLKTENSLARYVGDSLATQLGSRAPQFKYIRNINKRGVGYVDAVLIGPPGVLVFRITDIEGEFLNEKGKWLRRARSGRLETMRFNPTQDVVDDMKTIKDYLAMREFRDVPIFGVVVFMKDSPQVKLDRKESVIPVTYLSGLQSYLRDGFLAKDRIDTRTANAIFDTLFDR